MDNAVILQQFEEIEKKIETLIQICKSHEVANSELKEKIKRLNEELQVKIEAENSYAKERDLVRSKINGLLGKLDEIIET
ncbi:MAG: cell division protein ZapB [Desulfobacteraceae bacterium]|nr:cell division protein ZapB [Desulfobacteraceae bacterium]MBC2719308.1 cell division protein ZapB [Desulfobacteraceae bacterium]